MTIIQSLIPAVQSILRNKLRSSLTMLGIVIGVAAVIALVAAGAGAQAEVLSRFEGMGANVLTISPGMTMMRGGGGARTLGAGAGGTSFTNADVETLSALATSVVAVAPQYSGQATVGYGATNTQVTVLGTTPEYLFVNDLLLDTGRFITALDLTNRDRVVVLSATMVETLFSGTLIDPLGQMVKINREPYVVVGVLSSEESNIPFMGGSTDVIIPLSTAQLKFGGVGNEAVDSISVKVASSGQVEFAKAQLRTILRSMRGLAEGTSDNFIINDPSQIVQNIESTSATFTTLLASIAAISLMVGGIGIMNIMLVSVTERTREIGIRKAVGAKRRHILTQFLVESTVLSVIGGATGILLGMAAAQVIAPLLGTERAIVTPDSVFLALAVSMGVGIFFGIYPANRASRLNPIDALRYE